MFYYLVNMYYCFCVLSYREARGFEVRGGIAAVIATSLFRRRRLSATKVLQKMHMCKKLNNYFQNDRFIYQYCLLLAIICYSTNAHPQLTSPNIVSYQNRCYLLCVLKSSGYQARSWVGRSSICCLCVAIS